MRLNLINDIGGRSFARAMSQAYSMGYDDAKELHSRGKRIYARKTGKDIARALTSKASSIHASFLRKSYGAGMYQYARNVAPKLRDDEKFQK